MSTAHDADELKQQGAIEAAQNPESQVTSDDAEKKMLEDSRKAGIVAMSFDPNASPAEKRAELKAAVPEGIHHRKKGEEIPADINGGTKPDYELPEPTKEGAVEVNGHAGGEQEEQQYGDKTGWAPQFGWASESIREAESLLDHSTWLEGRVPDAFFGDWYHNAAIIVFACITSWLVAVLGGGLGWVFIIMAACSTYYRTSVRRVRRNFRDDVNREMQLKRLENDHESLEWINLFMVKFWPIYQPVLAATVISSVDQVLSSATPSFLDSLKVKMFTLGSKPPRMEHVKTYPKADDDVVIMDWKFSFTPNDTSDMTARQLKNKINPKIVLEVRVGKAMISKGLDVIVEDMAFSGIMRLKVKLQIPFPHVEKIEMCFLERPTIDYVCKPLGGDTFGFDINFIPGLESFILEQIHGNLAPMMYAPNVFPIEVAKMLAGSPVDRAIGVVAITLHGAEGLKNPDNFSGTTDPYATVSLNKREPLAQTKTIRDTANPRWNETHYIIVTSFNDSLDVQVFDFNDFRKDKELGTASFPLEGVEEIHEFENERLEISANGKARGALSCDIRFFPVLEPKKLPDGKEEPPPESNTGVLRFTVDQAKDLDGTKSLVGLLNPYAVLLLNGKEVHTTKPLRRTNNPIWDNGSKDFLVTDRRHAKMGVVIKDERGLTGDQIIGTYQIRLDDMLELMEKGQDWFNLSGVKTGRAKMQAQWRPVAIQGIVAGTGGYVTPIGVMRFHLKSAKDLRNFETMGKSDPYGRVLLSGIEKARTVTFRNNLNPEWDEILYVPVHSPRDRLQLEVMDAETVGKDRTLGLVEVFAGEYITQGEMGEYLPNDKKTPREDGLRIHGKGIAKGVLNYTVAFYPCLNVADHEEEEEGKETEKEKEGEEEKKAQEGAGEEKKPLLDATTRSAEASGESSSTSLRNSDEDAADTPKTPTSQRKSGEERGPPKVRLSPEELLKYDTGLVIFRLMDAELPKGQTHVEIFVDDMAYPSYTSSTAQTRTFKFDEIGDCLIRELEFSRLTLKVCEKGESHEEDHTLARLTGNTLDTLKQCLNNPTMLKMKDEEGRTSFVKISLKYIPVMMQLDPSESINNMGNMRVDVLDAADLPAADSNGKSDPYCKFELNGREVFKTKVQKKTLHPAWNEFFELPVPSRTRAKFHVTVYDWDFAERPDFLGAADINLEHLDPFQPREVKLVLDGKSGVLRLRLLFRPDYVTRQKMGTSTFLGGTSTLSGTFAAPTRIVTGVAGAPLKGGAAVVAHGVGKGASFLKRGFRSSKGHDDHNDPTPPNGNAELPTITTTSAAETGTGTGTGGLARSGALAIQEGEPTPPETPLGPANGGSPNHVRTKSFGGASVHSMAPGAPGSGTSTFTVVSASGFTPSSDVYVVVNQLTPKHKTIGKTKHHKASASGAAMFDETFRCTCTPDTQFQVQAKEHNTFTSDDDLGETIFFVDESSAAAEKEIRVGDGTVTIKSNFVPAADAANTDGPRASLRRAFLSKRDSRVPSRETTPNP